MWNVWRMDTLVAIQEVVRCVRPILVCRCHQVLPPTGSRDTGIATIFRCLACKKTAADVRVAVVLGKVECQ